MNHFVRELVKEKIQPAVIQSLSEYKMTGFQFGRLVLGRIVSGKKLIAIVCFCYHAKMSLYFFSLLKYMESRFTKKTHREMR